MRNPYTVLGVSSDADASVVRKAYKRLAREHHPDRSQEPDAVERFKEVTEAYSILTNERERARYVRKRRREHAEQQRRQRKQTEDARRREQTRQSAAASAAEEVFWDYARQVRERRRQQEAKTAASAVRQMMSGKPAVSADTPVQRLGSLVAIGLLLSYLWRSTMGLPLQPWLPGGGAFATHPLASPIWITLGLSLMMIVKPRWFLMPYFIEGPNDVRLGGWGLFLLCPFISAGGPSPAWLEHILGLL